MKTNKERERERVRVRHYSRCCDTLSLLDRHFVSAVVDGQPVYRRVGRPRGSAHHEILLAVLLPGLALGSCRGKEGFTALCEGALEELSWSRL